MKKVIIYGATSAIAQGCAKLFAKENADLMFISRSKEKNEALATDYEVRYGKKPLTLTHDAINTDTLESLFNEAVERLGGLDVILIAHGILPNQERAETDIQYLNDISIINGNSTVYFSQLAANYMKERGEGTIAVISSVAGDRGRYSNYIYGATKGYISIFLQGLRNKMAHFGVNVLTVKPGFVDTPMTAHLQKNFLFATGEEVGADIYKAIKKGKGVIYSKKIWAMVMLIIRNVPGFIFNKMKM